MNFDLLASIEMTACAAVAIAVPSVASRCPRLACIGGDLLKRGSETPTLLAAYMLSSMNYAVGPGTAAQSVPVVGWRSGEARANKPAHDSAT
jgi:hypothetical protein